MYFSDLWFSENLKEMGFYGYVSASKKYLTKDERTINFVKGWGEKTGEKIVFWISPDSKFLPKGLEYINKT